MAVRRHAWWLFGMVGLLVVTVLAPAGGDPSVPVGGQAAPAVETFPTDGRYPMAAPVVLREGFLLAGVSELLAKRLTSAQDAAGPTFTIAIDGGPAEPLPVSAVRLRDFQNIYYRVIGRAGAWQLEEHGFSPTGADSESKLIRRSLGVPDDRRIHFLPGRQHVLIPAQSSVVLFAGGERWDSRVAATSAKQGVGLWAVALAAGQAVPLDLDSALSTASTQAGALVLLVTAKDVVAEGLVAITRGTSVEARVVDATPPDVLGNPGALVLELGVAKAVDGSDVPLAGPYGRRHAFTGSPGALFLVRARHLELASGTRIIARVSRRVVVLAPVPTKLDAVGAVPRRDGQTQ